MKRHTRIVLAGLRRRRLLRPSSLRYRYHTCLTPLESDLRMHYEAGVLTLFGVTPETLQSRLDRAIHFTGQRVLAQITP